MRRFKEGNPFITRFVAEHRLHQRHQFIAVRHPLRIGGKARLGVPFLPHHTADGGKLFVVAAGQNQVLAVRRFKYLIRHNIRVRIAQARRHAAGSKAIHAHIGAHGHGAVEQRHIHLLPQPGLGARNQGCLNADGELQTGKQIHHRHAHFVRQAVGGAGDAHQAAQALDNIVVAGFGRIGSGLAKAGKRGVNQAGVALLEAVVIQPVFF